MYNWLVVSTLWKTWKSVVHLIPNIWKNKFHVPNHQPDNKFPSKPLSNPRFLPLSPPWVFLTSTFLHRGRSWNHVARRPQRADHKVPGKECSPRKMWRSWLFGNGLYNRIYIYLFIYFIYLFIYVFIYIYIFLFILFSYSFIYLSIYLLYI